MSFPVSARPLLLAGAALVLVVTGLAVATTRVVGGPLEPAAADVTCADVLVLGATGSGERASASAPLGRTLDVLRTAYVASTDRSVEIRSVGVPAPRPATLRRKPGVTGSSSTAISRQSVVRWEQGIRDTIAALRTAVHDAVTACPDQQLVLVGYAQGAMSVHRYLTKSSSVADLDGRFVGAALVADGDRAAGTTAFRAGAPAAGKNARGVEAFFRSPRPDVPVSDWHQVVWSVCTSGDVACAVGRTPFGTAVAVHRGYASGAGADVLRKVAGRLAGRTAKWARPIVGQVAPAGSVGAPMDEQLQADVADSETSRLRWSDAAGLPPGITLTEDGRLQGTPTEAGSWDVSYTVTNTRPGMVHPLSGSVAVRVLDVAPLTISAGGEHSCAVKQDGTLWCWGRNTWGEVGNGTRGPGPAIPTQVGSATNWSSVAAGGATSCGIRTSGQLFCWGLNNSGQVGDGSHRVRTKPRRVGTDRDWRQVSVGWFTGCGVREDGSGWCWGGNAAGQLGSGVGGDRTAPVRVPGDGWRSISVGGWHACGVKRDGTLWCWGRNTFGQRGDGTVAEVHQPVQVGPGKFWASVSTSWSHTCGVLTSGEVRCWGRNDDGQVGDGTTANRPLPQKVKGLPPIDEVAAGEGSTCALDRDGMMWCWGSDAYGFLADDGHANQLTPVATGIALDALSAGWMHACGLTSAGASRCWGNNERGQVGDGSTTDARRPTPQEWP